MKASKMSSNPGQISPDKDDAFYQTVKDFLRPNLVLLTECKIVLLEGVTFQNSPAWCLHPLMCENLTVRNVFVKNPWYAQGDAGVGTYTGFATLTGAAASAPTTLATMRFGACGYFGTTQASNSATLKYFEIDTL